MYTCKYIYINNRIKMGNKKTLTPKHTYTKHTHRHIHTHTHIHKEQADNNVDLNKNNLF